jgi:hypothetical protein
MDNQEKIIFWKSKTGMLLQMVTHGIYDTIAFIFVFYGLSLDKIL